MNKVNPIINETKKNSTEPSKELKWAEIKHITLKRTAERMNEREREKKITIFREKSSRPKYLINKSHRRNYKHTQIHPFSQSASHISRYKDTDTLFHWKSISKCQYEYIKIFALALALWQRHTLDHILVARCTILRFSRSLPLSFSLHLWLEMTRTTEWETPTK